MTTWEGDGTFAPGPKIMSRNQQMVFQGINSYCAHAQMIQLFIWYLCNKLECICVEQDNKTAVMRASEQGHDVLVHLLVEAKAGLDFQSKVCCPPVPGLSGNVILKPSMA